MSNPHPAHFRDKRCACGHPAYTMWPSYDPNAETFICVCCMHTKLQETLRNLERLLVSLPPIPPGKCAELTPAEAEGLVSLRDRQEAEETLQWWMDCYGIKDLREKETPNKLPNSPQRTV